LFWCRQRHRHVNLPDCPANVLATHGIEAQHLDTSFARAWKISRTKSGRRCAFYATAAARAR
jgi:hypothetical protein